jgi:hypothetical protein
MSTRWTVTGSWPLALLALLVLSGCDGGGGGEDAEAVVRFDSAGVSIVENHAPAWELDGADPAWVVAPEPDLAIGVMEGDPDYQFGRVVGVVALPDGRIVVGDAQARDGKLRLFAPDGTLQSTAGPEGEGPEGIMNLSWLAPVSGDRIGVWDSNLNRLSILSAGSGGLEWDELRSLDLSHPDPPDPPAGTQLMIAMSPTPVGLLADGSLVGMAGGIGGTGFLERYRTERALFHWDPAGEVLHSLGTIPGGTGTTPDLSTGSTTAPPTPFPGREVTGLHDDRLYHGADEEGYVIRVLRPDGTLERLIRRTDVDLAVTPELRSLWRDEEIARAEDPDEHRERVAQAIFPEMRAPFEEMRIDDSGYLWLRDPPVPGAEAPVTWQVFEPDGRHLGGVAMPDGFSLRQVGEDFVLGVYTDDFDVPYIHRYRLEGR